MRFYTSVWDFIGMAEFSDVGAGIDLLQPEQITLRMCCLSLGGALDHLSRENLFMESFLVVFIIGRIPPSR